MRIFSKYISHKVVLNVLLGIAVVGMFAVIFSVNRLNCLLNTDLGFNKDDIYTIRTKDSRVVLPDSLVFSSQLPGFSVNNKVQINSEYSREYKKMAHQFISDQYFDFFNYEKIVEKPELFLDHGRAQLVYLNEAAVKDLGIYSIYDAIGTRLLTKNNMELLVCGVVREVENIDVIPSDQGVIYQLSSEHLTYAYYQKDEKEVKGFENAITYRQRIQNHYKIWEDIIYSTFLIVNVIILLVCLGYIGNKFAIRKERELFKILGTGVHILTLVISKTYLYLLAIIGFVVGPLALLIQKFWLGIYAYKIHFGLIDLFIILSMALLTVYLLCCPKRKIIKRLKGKSIQLNSI